MRHPPSQVTDDSDLDVSAEEGDFNNDLQQALDKFSLDLESDRNDQPTRVEASANFSSTPNKLNATRSAADTGSDVLSSLGQILGEESERDPALQLKSQPRFGGNSETPTREPTQQRSNLEQGSESYSPQKQPYYSMSLQNDGKYYCPFNTGDNPCNHPPTTQQSVYR